MKIRIGRRALSCGIALSLAAASMASAGTLSPQFSTLNPNQTVQVIVQYNEGLVGSLLSTVCGLTNLIELLPTGELCSMTVSAVLNLAQSPFVAHISVDNTLQAASTPLPVYDYMPQAIQPASASAGTANATMGANIGVAVIDSGITVNQDLTGNGTGSLLSIFPNVVYAESFVSGEGVNDLYGHGTHIAGSIAGNGANSYGSNYLHDIHGVAPGAHLINLKVLDKNGEADDATVILGIERAIQLKDIYNIKVINLSLGRAIFESYKTDPLCQEVEKAWRNGITVVVAAGNEGRNNTANTNGYGTIAAPGNDPLVITVGAMNTESTPQRSDDLMTTYSSKGPDVDRSGREARSGGAGEQDLFDHCAERDAGNDGVFERGSGGLVCGERR